MNPLRLRRSQPLVGELPRDKQMMEVVHRSMAVRAMLERAWSPATAYQGITLTPEDVPARGQCGVSSLWLARYLAGQGLDAQFTEGKIHLLSGEGDEHVWVEARGVSDEPLVVDITSDQYRSVLGATVHIGKYADNDEVIGRYTPENYFDPYAVPRKKLLGRFALLEERLAGLPRRHRALSLP